MATIFVVLMVYSFSFGAMTALNWNSLVIICFAFFFSLVGVAQAVMYRGTNPRRASIFAGAIGLACVVAFFFLIDQEQPGSILFASLIASPFGAIAGYLTGALVGGIFLIADFVRSGRGVME